MFLALMSVGEEHNKTGAMIVSYMNVVYLQPFCGGGRAAGRRVRPCVRVSA